MHVILSHNNLDFDALASMIAAQKLHPEARLILPSRTTSEVDHFITIYKDVFTFLRPHECSWEEVEHITLVDTSILDRQVPGFLSDRPISIYDHHLEQEPLFPQLVHYECEAVGACITLLVEKLQENHIRVSPLEATIFILGLYSDTESFTLPGTVPRDLEAGAFLLQQGANLRVMNQFREVPLTEDQQRLFQDLLENQETHSIQGIDVITTALEQEHYTGHLAHITSKLLQVTGVDGVVAVVRMGRKTFITCRAASEQVDFRPLMAKLGGGGHAQAASASMKDSGHLPVLETVKQQLDQLTRPAMRAADMMSSPVRVIAPETPVDTAAKMIYRYGHSGFPVVADGGLVGIISRRDIDKALHHGLGHAPVKGFMQHSPVWIDEDVRLEKIRAIMMDKQVGRLPVLRDGELIGIVSRSDVIAMLHGHHVHEKSGDAAPIRQQVSKRMEQALAPALQTELHRIGQTADKTGLRAYLIGGIVRDMFLGIANEDLDVVVEGDAVTFAESLKEAYGGYVRPHPAFRTAGWRTPDGVKVDLSSARIEYYDFPAALPAVEPSSIKEDLYRRDFTVNTLAVSINEPTYGELIDYFNGLQDLQQKRLKVLYNLSFVEDPTRILRALRFETRFSFRMEPQTKFLAEDHLSLLSSVSHARLSDELSRLFKESDPRMGMERLLAFRIHSRLFSNTRSERSASAAARRLHRLARLFHADLVWISWLCCLVQAEKSALAQLVPFHQNKTEKKLVEKWIAWMEKAEHFRTEAEMHQVFRGISDEDILPFAALFLSPSDSSRCLRYLYKRAEVKEWVSGKDLLEAGWKPGRYFSEAILEGEILKLSRPDLSKKEIITQMEDRYVQV
ncbi:CBS domain-containing protein [Alkalicoccus chagannorensis]|uniref:CBS domain-containing protein n=1 Tax=Alkalicoccus chagannorensis TaxID=427072 RepID=UPI000412D349|nr:CBS domain-containing protein [Alkalicoccus chagannorensis]